MAHKLSNKSSFGNYSGKDYTGNSAYSASKSLSSREYARKQERDYAKSLKSAKPSTIYFEPARNREAFTPSYAGQNQWIVYNNQNAPKAPSKKMGPFGTIAAAAMLALAARAYAQDAGKGQNTPAANEDVDVDRLLDEAYRKHLNNFVFVKPENYMKLTGGAISGDNVKKGSISRAEYNLEGSDNEMEVKMRVDGIDLRKSYSDAEIGREDKTAGNVRMDVKTDSDGAKLGLSAEANVARQRESTRNSTSSLDNGILINERWNQNWKNMLYHGKLGVSVSGTGIEVAASHNDSRTRYENNIDVAGNPNYVDSLANVERSAVRATLKSNDITELLGLEDVFVKAIAGYAKAKAEADVSLNGTATGNKVDELFKITTFGAGAEFMSNGRRFVNTTFLGHNGDVEDKGELDFVGDLYIPFNYEGDFTLALGGAFLNGGKRGSAGVYYGDDLESLNRYFDTARQHQLFPEDALPVQMKFWEMDKLVDLGMNGSYLSFSGGSLNDNNRKFVQVDGAMPIQFLVDGAVAASGQYQWGGKDDAGNKQPETISGSARAEIRLTDNTSFGAFGEVSSDGEGHDRNTEKLGGLEFRVGLWKPAKK